MKLITYVINYLLLFVCITTVAMEQSLICKKATQSHVNYLLKKIKAQEVHDANNVMNMVRENTTKGDKSEADRTPLMIKVSGCFV